MDAPLELAQLVGRLEPELLDELPPAFPVDGERLGLTVVAVEREHQQPSQSFAQGMARDDLLQLGEDVGAASGSSTRSASAAPRQSASASPYSAAASSWFPAADPFPPRASRPSNTSRSSSPGSTTSA